jgi:hypothetical protein
MAPARRDASSREDDDGESGGPRAKPASGWISDDDEVPVEPVVRSSRPTEGVPFLFRRVAYISDSYLSQSVYQSYALLFGAVTLIVGGGFAYHAIDTTIAVFDAMWATFTWISTGILSSGVVPLTNGSRAVAGALVIVGILYFSVVLALVVEAVQFKMKALREGKSMVVEKDHIVMLGWSEKSLLFIREIILANESEGGGVVVVLCTDGKEKMERELSLMLKHREMKGTSVVFRQGSRLMVGDLDKVSVHTAKAVVVFSNSGVESDKGRRRGPAGGFKLIQPQLTRPRRGGGAGQGQRGVDPLNWPRERRDGGLARRHRTSDVDVRQTTGFSRGVRRRARFRRRRVLLQQVARTGGREV